MKHKKDAWNGEYLISGTTYDRCYVRTFKMGDTTFYRGLCYKRVLIDDNGTVKTAFIKWTADEEKE